MTNLSEASCYNMMGLNKVFLRNFLIGCFLLLVTSVTTLATMLNKLSEERRKDEKEFRATIVALNQKCAEMAETKNAEYILMLRQALLNQKEIDRELEDLKRSTQ